MLIKEESSWPCFIIQAKAHCSLSHPANAPLLSDFRWGEVAVAGTAGEHARQFTPLVPWGRVLRAKSPRGDGTSVTRAEKLAKCLAWPVFPCCLSLKGASRSNYPAVCPWSLMGFAVGGGVSRWEACCSSSSSSGNFGERVQGDVSHH